MVCIVDYIHVSEGTFTMVDIHTDIVQLETKRHYKN